MKRFTKDDILATRLKTEEVEIEAWDCTLLIRELTAQERDAYEISLMNIRRTGTKVQIDPNMENAKAKMAVKCIIDDEGNRYFSDEEAVTLGRKSSAALNAIVENIQRLSAMSKKDIDDLEKNSETTQGISSPSASV